MLRELRHLSPHANAQLRLLVAGLVGEAVLAGIALSLTLPFLKNFIAGNIDLARYWLFLLLFCLTIYGFLRFSLRRRGYDTGLALGKMLLEKLSAHLERIPTGWFTSQRIGEIGRLSSQGIIDVMVLPAHLLHPIIGAVVTPATLILCVMWLDWRLAVGVVAAIPVLIWLQLQMQGRLEKTDLATSQSAIEVENRISEFASAQPALRMVAGFLEHLPLEKALAARRIAEHSQLVRIAPTFVGLAFMLQIAFVLTMSVGVGLFLVDEIDVISLVVLLFLLVRMTEPLSDAADLAGQIQIARNSLKRLNTILDVAPLTEPLTPLKPKGFDLSISEITFELGAKTILRGVSLTCPENSLTAIVGPSGSGKSTLLSLILRLWDVDKGSIQIGGVDLRMLGSECTRRYVAAVFQDLTLPEGSIGDAILAGQLSQKAEVVEVAVARSGINDMSSGPADWLDRPTGLAGTSLSKGQRQRISLARALVKATPILLLDEPTSALDCSAKKKVCRTLKELSKDHTLLVVTHDLSLAASADQIAFLDAGELVEFGRHKELMAQKSRYAAFHKHTQH